MEPVNSKNTSENTSRLLGRCRLWNALIVEYCLQLNWRHGQKTPSIYQNIVELLFVISNFTLETTIKPRYLANISSILR